VSAGANPANVDQIVELIRQEITRFVSEPVDEDELADSQANYIGRLPLSLESNAGVTAALINLQRYERDLDYFLHFPDLVRAVTREEILETARRYLVPNGLGVAIAGP
jgi:zinc protease